MPVVSVITGDLFDSFERGFFNAIGHGCNCQNAMGAGIAPVFKKKYPMIGVADSLTYQEAITSHAHENMLGSLSYAQHKNMLCLNLYTQFNPGCNGDYHAIASAFQEADKLLLAHFPDGYRLGLPFIGCGIAGLDINAVIALANTTLLNGDVYFIQTPADKEKRPNAVAKSARFHKPRVHKYKFCLSADGCLYEYGEGGLPTGGKVRIPFGSNFISTREKNSNLNEYILTSSDNSLPLSVLVVDERAKPC